MNGKDGCKPANGYNPMRYNCDRSGCFNVKKRPKIEAFADCFPGKINFTDVDGIVEINGHVLMLEWKPAPVDLPTGQRIMFEHLTADGSHAVIVVAGDPETMTVSHCATVFSGAASPWRPASLEDVKGRMEKWSSWARTNKRKVAA